MRAYLKLTPLSLLAALTVVAACGDNKAGLGPNPDASRADAAIDAAIDAAVPDGIGPARMTADGAGLDLPIRNVVVTYLKPQIGSLTNDPAGFTIQASKMGPALFVSVDPATLTPPAAVGDVVSFQITTMGTVAMQRRAQAISGYTRVATGANVAALAQDISAATDVVSMVDSYDSEIVSFTATVADNFVAGGQSFSRATLTTAGISGDTNFQIRAPAALADSLDMAMGCRVVAAQVPVNRFNAQAQLSVFTASDFMMTNCPAPVVTSVVALSATSVRVSFSRNIKPSSVNMNGSQFTFDNGLTVTAAAVSGRTVTLTTSAQAIGTTYTVTVATALTDLQNTPLGTPNSGTFGAFVAPAVVRINEVNANITGGCDLIELRVVASGSMANFKIQERTGVVASGELALTFPAGFLVQKNDFIVVHMNSGFATCNPNGATQETTSPTQQPASMFGGNFDTAYDFWSADTGLTATDNVFILFDAATAIIDAVFISDDPAGPTAATATENAAAIVGMANQWQPALTMYIDTVFRMHAADDLNATGNSAAGTSIQRLDNTDDNDKADWTTGAGAASTWGALNAGQTAF